MPQMRSYKAGSIIYFRQESDEKADNLDTIFVLQDGKVSLSSLTLDTQEEVKEDLLKGEFFGVKSALGKSPREETAMVMADAQILMFSIKEFEALCLKNPRIVLQMLKVFSGQLRRIHKTLHHLLGESHNVDNAVNLLKTAEFYHKSARLGHAIYAYEAFLKSYESHSLNERAQDLLRKAQQGDAYPGTLEPLGSTTIAQSSSPTATAADAMEDSESAGQQNSEAELLSSDISSALINKNYDEAIELAEKLLAMADQLRESEQHLIDHAAFDKMRTYKMKGELDQFKTLYKSFLKDYGHNQKLMAKAMLEMAELHKKEKSYQEGLSLVKAVLKLNADDSDKRNANNLLRDLESKVK